MRTIKFRIWDKQIKDFLTLDQFRGWHDEFWKHVHNIFYWPSYVQQFTGLTDVQGKDIYEGDILEHIGIEDYRSTIGPVTFEDGRYLFRQGRIIVPLNSRVAEDCKIIGNTFKNPELLA